MLFLENSIADFKICACVSI